MQSSPPAALPAWLRPAILALAAILLMACFSTEVADSDTWLHLETGKYVVEHHQIPIPDPFSFTTYLGKPLPGEETVRAFNLTHSWLGQTIIYLAYAAGGFGGMVLLRAMLMTAYCFLAGLWAYRRSQSFYGSLAAAAVTAFIASYFSSDRPYQITYVLIVATILILEYRRWMWLLPPMFLFWANCHGGFFMGFVVLGTYCAESLWQRLRGKPAAGERRLWLVTAVCVPAAFLNPNGFHTLYILLAYKQSSLTSTIYEWQKPPLWPPTFLSLLLVAAAAVLVWQRQRTRLVDWVLLVLFGAAYLSAVRNSNLVGLVAPVLIVSYLPSSDYCRASAGMDGMGGRACFWWLQSPSRSRAGAPSKCAMPSGSIPPAPPISCWRTTSRSPCSTPSTKVVTWCGAAGPSNVPSSMDAASMKPPSPITCGSQNTCRARGHCWTGTAFK